MGYNAPTNTYDTFQDLRLAIGQSSSSVTVLGRNLSYDGLGGVFAWYSTAEFSDDDSNIIQPLNIPTGRWIRCTQGDVFSGTVVRSADGVQTSFTINLPLALSSDNYQISIQPLSLVAFGTFEITKSETNFTIVFTTPPTAGIGNLRFDYIIRHNVNIGLL